MIVNKSYLVISGYLGLEIFSRNFDAPARIEPKFVLQCTCKSKTNKHFVISENDYGKCVEANEF
jgi:hypothetical protein